MAIENISVHTDSELIADAQSVLADLGLDMSMAIILFLHHIVNNKAIPFELADISKKHAKLGGWEGKISMSDDFNEPMDEFKEYME